MANLLALITIIAWPVIPLFWIPVHFHSQFFRKIKLLTYLLPLFTWLPLAYLIYLSRSFLLQARVDFPVIVNMFGVLLLVSGTLLHVWTGKLLSIWGLIGLPEVYTRIEGRFVKEGAFSVVRHPTYLAHTLMFAGIFLITGVISIFIITVLDLLAVNMVIIPLEEKELLNRFGDKYRKYINEVPKIVPSLKSGIWRLLLIKLYTMTPLGSKSIEKYVGGHTDEESPLLRELEEETRKKMENPQMIIGRVEGLLLRMLVRISGSKTVLEIGTFTGYSALMMAEGLPDDGHLVTCEINKEHADMAQRYFDRSPLGHIIDLKHGDAVETIKNMPDNSFDFIFIDADKTHYVDYYEEALRLLKRGGLIAVDNTLWSGAVLAPRDDNSRAIASFNDMVKDDARVEKTMLTIRDGIYLIRKK